MIDVNSLNEKQIEAISKAISQERNLYIAGAAGTGKSAVIEWIEAILKDKGINSVVCAMSAFAASLVNGITLHKFLGASWGVILPYEKPKERNSLLDATDVIIIDEISFVGCDMIAFLKRAVQASIERNPRKVTFIVVGDFFQLGPVVNDEDREQLVSIWGDKAAGRYPFIAPEWEGFDFEVVRLTEQMRVKDREYLENCERIKHRDLRALTYFNQKVDPDSSDGSVFLCARKDVARRINNKRLSQLDANEKTYHTTREGLEDRKAEVTDDVLTLKVGAPVIALANDKHKRFNNGAMGVVVDMDDDTVIVRFNNGKTIPVERCTLPVIRYIKKKKRTEKIEAGHYTQIPLAVAYAITIHKAQGLTLDAITLDPSCFASGQLYTALTRVRGLDSLTLTRPIEAKDVIIDPVVEEYYEKVVLKAG